MWRCATRLRAHAEAATAHLDGVWIEPKTFGFGVHTRRAGAAAAAEANRLVDAIVAAEAPHWRRRTGHNIVEYAFRHEGKDSAIAELRERIGATAVLFAGDDVTDEDALREPRPRRPRRARRRRADRGDGLASPTSPLSRPPDAARSRALARRARCRRARTEAGAHGNPTPRKCDPPRGIESDNGPAPFARDNTIDIKPRSRVVTDGIEATTSRGMLRAVGMGDADWDKPQIGIASSWNEITPCNLSLDRLAQGAKEGVHAGGGYPLQFGTISVSDGISMGHEGMHFSLVSREVIADSVETVIMAERLDGSVLLAGCDKSIPGHADGLRPARPVERLPLRRLDRARLGEALRTAPRRTSRSSTRSRPSAPASRAR